MSGLADRQSQMPPQPPNRDTQYGPPDGNILTSSAATDNAGATRLAQASPPLPAPRAQATAGNGMPQLSPVQRDRLFQQYMRNLAPREGGTVNLSKAQDPAGLTHKGISTEFLKSYRTQYPQKNLPADPRRSRQSSVRTLRAPNFSIAPGSRRSPPSLV